MGPDSLQRQPRRESEEIAGEKNPVNTKEKGNVFLVENVEDGALLDFQLLFPKLIFKCTSSLTVPLYFLHIFELLRSHSSAQSEDFKKQEYCSAETTAQFPVG